MGLVIWGSLHHTGWQREDGLEPEEGSQQSLGGCSSLVREGKGPLVGGQSQRLPWFQGTAEPSGAPVRIIAWEQIFG